MWRADSEFDREDYLDVFYDQGLDEDGKLFAFPAYGTHRYFIITLRI